MTEIPPLHNFIPRAIPHSLTNQLFCPSYTYMIHSIQALILALLVCYTSAVRAQELQICFGSMQKIFHCFISNSHSLNFTHSVTKGGRSHMTS